MKRREFVKSSTAFTALSVVGLSNLAFSFVKPKQPMGVQLYTVRDLMKKDVPGTIAKVAGIGYTHVEGAGYNNRKFYGMGPKDFKSLLSDNGLTMPSSHVTTPFLKNSANETFEDAATAGCEYVVLAWLAPNERTSLDDYRKIIELVNTSSEIASKHGIKLGYHNHDFEFVKLDGQIPYELMMKELSTEIPMELDLYWSTRIGQNPVELFDKYPGRFPLWHVKDMDDTPEKAFTEVGNGTIDFKPIFKKERTAGLKYFFVEQDVCKRPPLESIEISYSNILKF